MIKIKFIFNTEFLKFISPIENIHDLYTFAFSYITIVLCKMRFITSYFVPDKTTYLRIGHNYWINLPKYLPSSLIFLSHPSSSKKYNGTFSFNTLNKLKYYKPSENFNQTIPLLESLKYLDFPRLTPFNQQITLSASIHYVRFGDYFNHPIIFSDNTNDLRYLIFGSDYNCPLEPPSSLKLLFFNTNFNQKIVLPSNLEYLKFGYSFKHTVVIPQTLKFLYLSIEHEQILDNLPNGLETLYIHTIRKNKLSNLPNGLKNLEVYNVSNMILSMHKRIDKHCWKYNFIELPKTIEHLKIEEKLITIIQPPNSTVREYLSHHRVHIIK